MNARAEARLWIAQRASAAVLALCVVVHLATMIYAVQGGLSAGEILARTRGNVAWLLFYVVFAGAVAIHAPIGLRSILGEWLGWRGRSRDFFLVVFGTLLAGLGVQAAFAVFK